LLTSEQNTPASVDGERATHLIEGNLISGMAIRDKEKQTDLQ
jgi:hypothetical protein